MNKHSPIPAVYVYDNVGLSIDSDIDQYNYSTQNDSGRFSDFIKLDEHSSLYKAFTGAIEPYINQYLEDHDIQIIQSHEALTLYRYEPSGFFVSHADDSGYGNRLVSFIYYINKDYVGGNVYFDNFDYTHVPQKDQLVIMPSNYAYRHSAQPVDVGVKYCIVGFLSKYKKEDVPNLPYVSSQDKYTF